MEPWLREVVDQIFPLRGLAPDDGPNCCHLAYYRDDEAVLGRHADDEALFGPLGSPGHRLPADRYRSPLPHAVPKGLGPRDPHGLAS